MRDGSVLKLHCCIPICTYRGTDKLQSIFRNVTMKLFSLYCNIVCNTETASSLPYLLMIYSRFIMINYPAHTEVEIHTSYFLLTVSWQWSWKLTTLSRFSIHVKYQKLNLFIQSTKFLQNHKKLSPSHQMPFRTAIVRARADGQSKSSKLTHNVPPFRSITEKRELIIPQPLSEPQTLLLVLEPFLGELWITHKTSPNTQWCTTTCPVSEHCDSTIDHVPHYWLQTSPTESKSMGFFP